MPTLLVYRGKVLDREFDLHGPTIRIGRAHENDLVLEDPTKAVSRFHAELRWDGDAHYRIADLGSQNGTWVNGARVEDARLEPGTTVAIGPYQLQLTQATAAMDAQRTTAVTAAEPDVSPAGDTPPILTAVVRGRSPGAPIGTPTPIRPQAPVAPAPTPGPTAAEAASRGRTPIPASPPEKDVAAAPPAPTPVPKPQPPVPPLAGEASRPAEPVPAGPAVPPRPPTPAAVAAAPAPPKAAAGPAAKPATAKTPSAGGNRTVLIGVAAAAMVVVGAGAVAWFMWARTKAPVETPATAPVESAAPAEATPTAAEPQAPAAAPAEAAETPRPADAAVQPPAPGVAVPGAEAGAAAAPAAPARRRSDSATGLEQAPRETVSAFNARVKRAKEAEGKLEAAFADNQVAPAEAALADLRQQAPAHQNLQAYDERLRTMRAAARQQQLDELMAQGQAAEQRGDLLAARNAYAEARRIDPNAAAGEWAGLTTKLTQEGQRILRTAEQDMLLSRRRAKEALPMFRRALEYLPDGHPDRARAEARIREIEAQ